MTRLLSRRLRLMGLSVASVFALLLAACGSSSKTAPFSATEMIQKANDNFGKTTSLHFKLTASNIAPGLYSVTDAEGDVERPDKMKVDGVAEVSKGFTASLGIIFIGDQQY